MNSNENKILLTIEIDEQATTKKLADLIKSNNELKESKKQLEKEYKAGNITIDEFSEKTAKANIAIAKNSKELEVQKRALVNTTIQQKAQAGSLTQLRANLSLATAAYAELSEEQRNNDKVGGQLQKQIKEYSDTLKDAEEKLGDHRRSVGDYAKGIRIAGISVGEMGDTIKEGVEATKVFTAGLFTTRGALIAITATPILLFLAGLVAFFTSTDDGADKLEQTLAGLRAGFDAVIKTIAPLGEMLIDTFTHPLESLEKFTEALAHPIDTFNKIRDANAKLTEQIATNFSTAARAAANYTKTMQEVEDNENALIVQREKVGLQVDQALLKVKDRSLSEKQKIEILRAAGKAEAELSAITVKNAQDAANAIRLRNEEFAKGRKLTDDEVVAQMEAEAAVVRAQRENLNTQQAIRNRETAQIEAAAAERKAAADKRAAAEKQRLQELVAESERALLTAKKLEKDTLPFEEEIIRRQLKVALADAKGNQQRLLLVAKAEADIAKLRTERAIETETRLNGITISGLNARLATVKKGTGQELLLQQQLLLAQQKSEIDQVKASVKNKEERAAKIKEIEAKSNAAILELNKQFAIAQIQADQQLAERREKIRTDLLNRFKRDQDKRDKEELAAQQFKLEQSEEGTEEELEARLALLNLELNQELARFEGTQQQKERILRAYQKRAADIYQAFNRAQVQQIIDISSQATDAIGSLQDAFSQRQLADLDRDQQAAVKSAGNNADLRAKIEETFQKRKTELEKKAAKERKKIASIENIIQGAAAATAALTTFAKNPVLGAITLALIGIKTLANQLVIDSQQFAKGGVPKRYTSSYTSDGLGGYIASGPGTPTSDSINARISVQESVMSAAATKKYYNELSYMNASVGGNPFPGAMPVSQTQAPTFRYGVVGLDTNNATTISRAVSEAVERIQPVLVLETLNQVQGNVNRTERRTLIK